MAEQSQVEDVSREDRNKVLHALEEERFSEHQAKLQQEEQQHVGRQHATFCSEEEPLASATGALEETLQGIIALEETLQGIICQGIFPLLFWSLLALDLVSPKVDS